ncbi:MAG: hypothetical protein MRY57_02735 [Candidatus Pacebacteria bacterium]|nr:hypothetical protein [Candidatus Paceibacterota bacterium]
MKFENSFLKQQKQNLENENKLKEEAIEKFQITEAEKFEIDNAIYRKKQEFLEDFSSKDREYIQEYFALQNQINLLEKETSNKIEKNLDEGILTLKLSQLNKYISQRNELENHFKINPHLSDYLELHDEIQQQTHPDDPQLN